MGYRGSGKTAYTNTLSIVISVLYFILLGVTDPSGNSLFMIQHGTMYEPLVAENGEYYRLPTSIFIHFGINYIVNNMLMLFVLGDNMKRALGHIKYLFFYLICGVGTNVASMTVNVMNKELMVSAGASGAVSGAIGGPLCVVAVNHGRLEDLSTRQLAVVILCSLYFGFTSGGVDNMAHIAGLLIGIVMAALLRRELKPIYEDGLWK